MTLAMRKPHSYPLVRRPPSVRPGGAPPMAIPDHGCGLASRRLRRPVKCLEDQETVH